MLSETEIANEPLIALASTRCRTSLDRLMLAILQDALATLQRGLTSKNPELFEMRREVDEWIRSRDGDWLFSFESICSTLGIDAEYLRGGLNEIRRDALADRFGKRVKKVVPRRLYTRRTYARESPATLENPRFIDGAI